MFGGVIDDGCCHCFCCAAMALFQCIGKDMVVHGGGGDGDVDVWEGGGFPTSIVGVGGFTRIPDKVRCREWVFVETADGKYETSVRRKNMATAATATALP